MGCLFSKQCKLIIAETDAEDDEDRYKFIYGNPLNSTQNINHLIQMHEDSCDDKIHI